MGAARYIATVPGRGYRFVAPVALRGDEAPRLQAAVAAAEGLRLVELPASGGSPTAVGTVFAEMFARAAYGIVVTGELRLRLGELELLLRPGSVVAWPGCNAPFPGTVAGVCRLIAAPLAPGEAEAGRGLG